MYISFKKSRANFFWYWMARTFGRKYVGYDYGYGDPSCTLVAYKFMGRVYIDFIHMD